MFETNLTKHSIRLHPGQMKLAEELGINVSGVCRDAVTIAIDKAARLRRLNAESLDARKERLITIVDEGVERLKQYQTPEQYARAKADAEERKIALLRAEDYYAAHPELRFW